MARLEDVIMDVPDSYSRYNLSCRNRFDAAPGLLIPSFVEEVQPGDDWVISPKVKVQTAPLLAPLMGSFQQEFTLFFVPTRLYTQGMDLDMPDFTPDETLFPRFMPPGFEVDYGGGFAGSGSNLSGTLGKTDPHCLLSYLDAVAPGHLSIYNGNYDTVESRNAIPLIGYYDIFRNFFRNTNEPNTYGFFSYTNSGITDPGNSAYHYVCPIKQGAWDSLVAYFVKQTATYGTMADIGDDSANTIGWTASPSFEEAWKYVFGPWTAGGPSMQVSCPTGQVSPSVIDSLHTSWVPFGGMMFTCYRPDMFTSWLDTQQYDRILSSSRINVESGQITMQQLFLSSHLYDYQMRGLVAGGRYSDWIYSQYGIKSEKNLCIPQILSVVREPVVFEEIVSQSTTTDGANSDVTGLGELAGRGHGFMGSRPIRFSSSEYGYLIGCYRLIPNVSYSQGYKPLYDKTEFGDLYKPSLNRIGFQALPSQWMLDTLLRTGVANDGSPLYSPANKTVVGYQPAWMEYRTNVDRLHGSFAVGEDLDYWTIGRSFIATREVENSALPTGKWFSDSVNYSSYILPFQFNYPFVDQAPGAANFLVEMAFNITARRRLSKLFTPKTV